MKKKPKNPCGNKTKEKTCNDRLLGSSKPFNPPIKIKIKRKWQTIIKNDRSENTPAGTEQPNNCPKKKSKILIHADVKQELPDESNIPNLVPNQHEETMTNKKTISTQTPQRKTNINDAKPDLKTVGTQTHCAFYHF